MLTIPAWPQPVSTISPLPRTLMTMAWSSRTRGSGSHRRPPRKPCSLRADLLADGHRDLLGPGDDRVGLALLGDHLQAGLLVRDRGEVDLDVHPGGGHRGARGLGGGGDVGNDVAVP